jgi:type II secretion system protein G
MQSSKLKDKNSRFHKGFTLIELLIVVTIIGVLTTIATVNFIGFRERARDAQRKSEIAQLQNALEFYRTDLNAYPNSTSFPPPCNTQFASGTTVYMKKTPCDPLQTTTRYFYLPSGTLTSYTLYACLENTKDKDKNTTTTRPTGGAVCTSGVYYVVNDP